MPQALSRRTRIFCLALAGAVVLFHILAFSLREKLASADQLDHREKPVDKSVGNDGCGLYQSGIHASWRSTWETEKKWLRKVHNCTRQFDFANVKTGDFDERMQTLDCHLDVTWRQIQQTVLRHDTLWFIGDSILKQQFLTLLCMVNPDLTTKDMLHYEPRTHKRKVNKLTAVEYICNNSTKLMYSTSGFLWHQGEINLYRQAFPQAVHELSDRDAIVLGASAHYSTSRSHLLEKAVSFIGNYSLFSKAQVYYMEPTPEEWPTTNGLFADGLFQNTKCQALTSKQLAGRYDTSHVKEIQRDSPSEIPPDGFLSRYPKILDAVRTANETFRGEECYPSCLPAWWRSEVARSILLDHDEFKVEMVPLFWQFVDKKTPTNRDENDCTHKSFTGSAMMNQQLIRTIMSRNETAV